MSENNEKTEHSPVGEVTERVLHLYKRLGYLATVDMERECSNAFDYVAEAETEEVESLVRELKKSKLSKDEIIEMYAFQVVVSGVSRSKREQRDANMMTAIEEGAAELPPKVHAVEQENIKNKKARTKGAEARHKENRQLKNDAFEWLDANFTSGKTLDAHAEDLKAIVPVSFKTRRRWVGEWKHLPSTSTGDSQRDSRRAKSKPLHSAGIRTQT